MSMSLAGKVCLITGASAGIGMATAVTFAKLGASLALCGRNVEGLRKAAQKCCEVAGKPEKDFILSLQADLGLVADRERVISETVKRFDGRLDVLVNNAGYFVDGGYTDPNLLTGYDKCFELNVKAPMHLIHLAVPYLAKGPGAVINLGSISGSSVLPGRIAYSMSKAAVHQMTECIALELAPKGIRVNCVSPGLIKTDLLTRSGVVNDSELEAIRRRAIEVHPLGRPGEPEEVADAIAFLASDASRFTTGIVLPIDGGRCFTCLR